MSQEKRRDEVRNIAIIAHVDHGKTTLVDALLKQTEAYAFKEGETTIMDSNDLERERGITIFSKNASFAYKGLRFNIVDTPGHADFGSEVERILKMVDGVLLLVDAFEGPMPQTKFVLKKSLERGLRPILVVNKVDRQNARPREVVDMTFDLFCELGATDEQLDFPIVFGSGRDGWMSADPEKITTDMEVLLDTVVRHVPPPVADVSLPFQMQVTMLEYDSFVGRIATGRVIRGRVGKGEQMAYVAVDGTVSRGRATKILKYQGLKKIEGEEALAGDIVSIAGIDEMRVGGTLSASDNPVGLPVDIIDEPTISMNFSHNTSPLAGKDGGKFLTSRHIRERLAHESMMNPGMRVEEADGGERFKVSGRGELHLAILIETMRREGYEIEVSRPVVIYKNIDGKKSEPVEELILEIDPEYQGAIMQNLGQRRAELRSMKSSAVGTLRLEFLIASRALMGFRGEYMTLTKGSGIMYQTFFEYQPYRGELPSRQWGVQISQNSGNALSYGLSSLQDRGELFVKPDDDIYEGMIVGVNNKGQDLTVNAIKGKKLTNMRASGSDDAITLTPPREMTLEFALEFIEDDELVEVTPKNVRLRKRYLNENDRKVLSRKAASVKD
ncbi:MAG: translational GTPase TypA [Candidatus Omnitrophica bacterium]|jgi:GTP-binding protein|nr:translational GTPase TypA [Candidatus Omnitrophota bacterium]